VRNLRKDFHGLIGEKKETDTSIKKQAPAYQFSKLGESRTFSKEQNYYSRQGDEKSVSRKNNRLGKLDPHKRTIPDARWFQKSTRGGESCTAKSKKNKFN